MEWRGKVQYVSTGANGETLYFRDWDLMLTFLRGALNSFAAQGDEMSQTLIEQAASGKGQ